MARNFNRAFALGFALLVVIFASGCQLRTLHVVVHGFDSSVVQGIDVYRTDEATGQPVYAGQIVFGSIVTQPDGSEALTYSVVTTTGEVTSGLQTQLVRAGGPDNADLVVLFTGEKPSGYYRVSSYNAAGASPLSADEIYLL